MAKEKIVGLIVTKGDSTIGNVIRGAVVLAALGVGIAFLATYWYIVVGIVALIVGLYALNAESSVERNKV